MTETTLAKRVNHYKQGFLGARKELLDLPNGVGAAIRRLDVFTSEDERSRELRRAKAEAERLLPSRRQAAQDALERAQSFVQEELNRLEPSERAQARVRRLLDQNKLPGEIAKRARELGDRDTLVALRDDIRWGVARAPQHLLSSIEHGIAELTPTDGETFGELVQMCQTAQLDEAERFVLDSVNADPGVARMRYAYGTNGANGEPAGGEDGSGEDGGGGGGAE
jgi:hypothetical protein